MAFESLKRILPKALQQAGISQQVTAARLLHEAKLSLADLWGEEKAQWVEAVSFQAGVLKLRSSAPAAVQELAGWKVRWQNDINRRLGSKLVTDIQIRIS